MKHIETVDEVILRYKTFQDFLIRYRRNKRRREIRRINRQHPLDNTTQDFKELQAI